MSAPAKSYLQCDFCKFMKWCIQTKNGKWFCDACLRMDLTDKQKMGNRMHPHQ